MGCCLSIAGLIGGCFIGNLACCCGTSAFGLWCKHCPSCKYSTSTRLMNAFLLFLVVIVSIIVLTSGVQTKLGNSSICANVTTIEEIRSGYLARCQFTPGYLVIYRFWFATTIYFITMCIFFLDVNSSIDPRSWIQNGFWFFKYIILGLMMYFCFQIHASSIFDVIWMHFGIIGSFLFILIQLLFLVDFAHFWAERWMERYENTGIGVFFCGLIFFTIFNYTLCLVLTIFLYHNFTAASGCSLHVVIISINLALCFIASGISILPSIQEIHPRSGLLQGSVVSLYALYLTWSAMYSSPYISCKPAFLPEHFKEYRKISVYGVIGVLFSALTIIYSSLSNSTGKRSDRLTIHFTVEDRILDKEKTTKDSDPKRENAWDDELEMVAYNWSFFYFMFTIASLYMMMVLTNWYQPVYGIEGFHDGAYFCMWTKIVSCWLAIFLYVWTLLAPFLFPERDFS